MVFLSHEVPLIVKQCLSKIGMSTLKKYLLHINNLKKVINSCTLDIWKINSYCTCILLDNSTRLIFSCLFHARNFVHDYEHNN